MKFPDRLRLLREEIGYSLRDMANATGLARSTINMYENGNREPNFETLEMLADLFNVDMDYLLGKSEIKRRVSCDEIGEAPNVLPIKKKRFPLLGKIACGEPIYAEEERESYVEAGTNIQADFCLRAAGDSMTGARIFDGDIVFIRAQDTVDNGEVAAVIINDEATLKRVFYDPEKQKLVLQAENPKYAPLVYVGDELADVRILGKAIAFQSDVR